MASEVWKPVSDYEGLYEVSNEGRVRRVGKSVLKPLDSKNGYYKVGLSKKGKVKSHFIHRLVATAFIPKPQGCDVVNHLDENKLNNRADNLQWTTLQDNFNYGTARKRSIKNMQRYWETHCNPRKKYIRCIELNKTYCGINYAAEELGLSAGNIHGCLNGKRHTTGGYHWEYVE